GSGSPPKRGGNGGGPTAPGPNGSGGGPLSGLIKRAKPVEEKEPVRAGARGTPPKPPRKKKKRSGRRR
ncbi:MAG TPA: hypothetical protein VIK04_19280, partial [Solirubrobacteraceae bacterium]